MGEDDVISEASSLSMSPLSVVNRDDNATSNKHESRLLRRSNYKATKDQRMMTNPSANPSSSLPNKTRRFRFRNPLLFKNVSRHPQYVSLGNNDRADYAREAEEEDQHDENDTTSESSSVVARIEATLENSQQPIPDSAQPRCHDYDVDTIDSDYEKTRDPIARPSSSVFGVGNDDSAHSRNSSSHYSEWDSHTELNHSAFLLPRQYCWRRNIDQPQQQRRSHHSSSPKSTTDDDSVTTTTSSSSESEIDELDRFDGIPRRQQRHRTRPTPRHSPQPTNGDDHDTDSSSGTTSPHPKRLQPPRSTSSPASHQVARRRHRHKLRFHDDALSSTSILPPDITTIHDVADWLPLCNHDYDQKFNPFRQPPLFFHGSSSSQSFDHSTDTTTTTSDDDDSFTSFFSMSSIPAEERQQQSLWEEASSSLQGEQEAKHNKKDSSNEGSDHRRSPDNNEPLAIMGKAGNMIKNGFVRWSDECGKDLATIHDIEVVQEETCRVIIVLMNAPVAPYEFLHCEFPTQHRLKVGDILKQLPVLRKQHHFYSGITETITYKSLCVFGQELLNILSIQDYVFGDNVRLKSSSSASSFVGIRRHHRRRRGHRSKIRDNNDDDDDDGDNELATATMRGDGLVFLAVREGCDCKAAMAEGAKLLANRNLRREIHKARIAGKALRTLRSSEEWQRYTEQLQQQQQQSSAQKKLRKRQQQQHDPHQQPKGVLRMPSHVGTASNEKSSFHRTSILESCSQEPLGPGDDRFVGATVATTAVAVSGLLKTSSRNYPMMMSQSNMTKGTDVGNVDHENGRFANVDCDEMEEAVVQRNDRSDAPVAGETVPGHHDIPDKDRVVEVCFPSGSLLQKYQGEEEDEEDVYHDDHVNDDEGYIQQGRNHTLMRSRRSSTLDSADMMDRLLETVTTISSSSLSSSNA